MKHEYYYYNKEELLKAPKIPLIVMEDNAAVFKSMADEMVEEIKRKNALGENTVFICQLVDIIFVQQGLRQCFFIP